MKTDRPLPWMLIVILGLCPCLSVSGAVLRGSVIEYGTRNPVPKAQVMVEDAGWGAVTDDHGMFEIPGMPPGVYTIRVSRIGFEENSMTHILIRENETASVLIELKEKPVEMDVQWIERDRISMTRERRSAGSAFPASSPGPSSGSRARWTTSRDPFR